MGGRVPVIFHRCSFKLMFIPGTQATQRSSKCAMFHTFCYSQLQVHHRALQCYHNSLHLSSSTTGRERLNPQLPIASLSVLWGCWAEAGKGVSKAARNGWRSGRARDGGADEGPIQLSQLRGRQALIQRSGPWYRALCYRTLCNV